MKGHVIKVSGNLSNGVVNKSLGRPNPTPSPKNTRGMTRKDHDTGNLSTRMPYDSRKGEIRNHKGL
jgi:hypothetical protein